MWTYHRVLQLLSTFSCFNAYLLLNVSILIKQDIFPSLINVPECTEEKNTKM